MSFRRDTKSWWSLLSGVYARGSKRFHTGGKCVTCSGLTSSRWTLNALQRAPSSIWEKDLYNYVRQRSHNINAMKIWPHNPGYHCRGGGGGGKSAPTIVHMTAQFAVRSQQCP